MTLPAGYYDPPTQPDEPDDLPTRCGTCGCYLRREWECEPDYEERVLHWINRCKRCGVLAVVTT